MKGGSSNWGGTWYTNNGAICPPRNPADFTRSRAAGRVETGAGGEAGQWRNLRDENSPVPSDYTHITGDFEALKKKKKKKNKS